MKNVHKNSIDVIFQWKKYYPNYNENLKLAFLELKKTLRTKPKNFR